jgi:hypothetical protein
VRSSKGASLNEGLASHARDVIRDAFKVSESINSAHAKRAATQRSITTMAPRTRGNVEVRQDADNGRPTIADLQGDGHFALLAKQHWLKSTKKTTKVKVKPDVVKKEIWDVLEREDFSYRSLLILENLQILEGSAFFLEVTLS